MAGAGKSPLGAAPTGLSGGRADLAPAMDASTVDNYDETSLE